MLSYICDISCVSRSGYYKYFLINTIEKRKSNEVRDLESKENILNAYNLKRIRRIMKATKEHTVLPNLLNRDFKQQSPGKVVLNDISYLLFKDSQKAYLSTILDASTNESLAYNISKILKIDIITDTLDKLIENNGSILREDSFIHSDQGVDYTSPIFQSKVENHNLGQSMSRWGNCWDNASQESFFEHLKDEVDIKSCETFEELEKEIDNYIDYYNNFRGKWNLKKITPVQYRNNLSN